MHVQTESEVSSQVMNEPYYEEKHGLTELEKEKANLIAKLSDIKDRTFNPEQRETLQLQILRARSLEKINVLKDQLNVIYTTTEVIKKGNTLGHKYWDLG